MNIAAYDHDVIDKRALQRILAFGYAAFPHYFAEDLANAFHWPATSHGAQYWLEISKINPSTQALNAADIAYLNWLLNESDAAHLS